MPSKEGREILPAVESAWDRELIGVSWGGFPISPGRCRGLHHLWVGWGGAQRRNQVGWAALLRPLSPQLRLFLRMLQPKYVQKSGGVRSAECFHFNNISNTMKYNWKGSNYILCTWRKAHGLTLKRTWYKIASGCWRVIAIFKLYWFFSLFLKSTYPLETYTEVLMCEIK
jgi:hypothetical protein